MSGAVFRPPLAFRRAPLLRAGGPGEAATAAAAATAATVAAAAPARTAGRAAERAAERAVDALRATTAQQAATGGLFIFAGLFLLSLLLPVQFHIFGLIFQPYRLWLMILLVPLLVMLLAGKAGKPMLVDWLMIGSTLWVQLSILRNHGGGQMVTGGTYVVEFLGAYFLARLAIRSAADFRRMVKLLFVIVLIMLPLAAIEGLLWVDAVIPSWIGAEWMITDIGGRLGIRRAQVVFEHPILYGAFVSTAFGLVWYALIPNAAFVARMFLVSFVGFATIFSMSTGAFLAVIVQLMLIGWELITRPHPQRWKIFAVLVVVGYLALDQVTVRSPFHTLVRYAAFNSRSSFNRILIFEHGMANVWANPLFGIGFRDWARPRWMSASVDNFWLLTAMRHGVPAFLMLAGAIVLIILRSARQTMIDPVDRACRAGYLTALGGIIIAGATVHYWRSIFVFIVFIIGSGVWMFTGGARSPAGPDPGASPQDDPPAAARPQPARARAGAPRPGPSEPERAPPIAARQRHLQDPTRRAGRKP